MTLLMILLVLIWFSLTAVMLSSPMALGGCTVIGVTAMSISVASEVGALYGFSLFMVVVSGMLVSFAYATALCPKPSFELTTKKVPIPLSLYLLTCLRLGKAPSESYINFGYGSAMTFNMEWGLLAVWLAVLLFMIMVGVVGLCSSTSGALVGLTDPNEDAPKIKRC